MGCFASCTTWCVRPIAHANVSLVAIRRFQLWQSRHARECFEFGEAYWGVMDWTKAAMMQMVLVMVLGGGVVWGSRVIGSDRDHGSRDEGGGRGDDLKSGRKVKFLYSFGYLDLVMEC